MAKRVYQIAVALMTDGRLPDQYNILNISASHDNFQFSQNIQAQCRSYHNRLEPEQYATLRKDAVPLADGLANLREWLKKFPGCCVAYCSSVDWMYLELAFANARKGNPFYAFPMDINTIQARDNGTSKPKSIRGADAMKKAIEIGYIVTGNRPYDLAADPYMKYKKIGEQKYDYANAVQAQLDQARQNMDNVLRGIPPNPYLGRVR